MSKRHGVTEFLGVFQDVATTFFDLESDILIVLDTRGDIERVNPAWEHVTGYTESEVLRNAIIHYVDVDDYAVFIHAFTDPHPKPFRMLHKGGGVVGVRLVACRFKQGRGFIVLRKA